MDTNEKALERPTGRHLALLVNHGGLGDTYELIQFTDAQEFQTALRKAVHEHGAENVIGLSVDATATILPTEISWSNRHPAAADV